MRNTILVILMGICLSCQTKKEPVQQSEALFSHLKDSLTAELTELHQLGNINGFGVGIVNQDSVLYARGFGFADVASKKPYTGSTLQNIGSVSKTFIGISLMKAQEQGKLDMDDPVNDYLPFEVKNPHFPDDPITLRHLATHTSGILDTEYYDSKSYILKEARMESDTTAQINEEFNPPDGRIPMMAFLENTLSEEGEWYLEKGFLENRPGTLFAYSNVGATLAAAALEVATGMTFNEFSTQHILEPLGMEASGWAFEDIQLSDHSTLYANVETPLPFYSLITYPDGGMICSPPDLSTYLVELINGYSGDGMLLSKESYQELFRPQLDESHLPGRDTENDFDEEYNSGIFMGFTPKGYIGHTGGDPGIATFMFFTPETRTGRLLMINTSIVSQEGVEQFFTILNTLIDYETRMHALIEQP